MVIVSGEKCLFEFSISVYDTSSTSNVVVLNTIHIDIMDYILPATCTDTEFRQMWQEFEWENKVGAFCFFTRIIQIAILIVGCVRRFPSIQP